MSLRGALARTSLSVPAVLREPASPNSSRSSRVVGRQKGSSPRTRKSSSKAMEGAVAAPDVHWSKAFGKPMAWDAGSQTVARKSPVPGHTSSESTRPLLLLTRANILPTCCWSAQRSSQTKTGSRTRQGDASSAARQHFFAAEITSAASVSTWSFSTTNTTACTGSSASGPLSAASAKPDRTAAKADASASSGSADASTHPRADGGPSPSTFSPTSLSSR
mmetsp:Transcript_12027/g.36206  ORF Transcript_12027/g.36206 Transcript_12027/m.36206 type:complete len:220 (+) Transcript_12027:315-974(+)